MTSYQLPLTSYLGLALGGASVPAGIGGMSKKFRIFGVFAIDILKFCVRISQLKYRTHRNYRYT